MVNQHHSKKSAVNNYNHKLNPIETFVLRKHKAMFNQFKAHINKFTAVSDEEFNEIARFFQIKTIGKKENLLEEGEICKSNYFVLKGVLRKFFVNEKGVEHTTEF